MRLFTTVAGLRCYLERIRLERIQVQGQPGEGKDNSAPDALLSVGLVPTMGALHDGHLSLMRRARQENDVVVVSIFVNPLQFGPNEDFRRYPRSLEHDQALCEVVGVDVIFAPTAAEFYQAESYQSELHPARGDAAVPMGTDSPSPDRITQVIPPAAMITGLCGRTRPGHFQGVATVVTKLLNAVQPQRAYFGQKDAQQLAIIKRIAADLNLPVEICPCPIVREPSGLALSSRNQYLSDEERSQATALYRGLKQAERLFRQGVLDAERLISAVTAELAALPTLQIDYVELVHPTTLQPLDGVHEAGLLAIAAYVGSTRLIDNIVLRNRKPIIAIDGPAGAGKSTVVRQVAQQLGLLYLDTGAMYRAVTWLALEASIVLDDEAAIAELVSQCKIDISGLPTESSIAINDQDVTRAIRSLEVTANVSAIAAQPMVRHALVKQQQRFGRQGGVVMDGRDIGTYVFPNAELKIFLTASVQERARRRQQDLKNQGQPDVSLEALEQAIYDRDWKDSHRKMAPLCKAADAIEISTDHLTIEEVTAKIINLYRELTAGDRP